MLASAPSGVQLSRNSDHETELLKVSNSITNFLAKKPVIKKFQIQSQRNLIPLQTYQTEKDDGSKFMFLESSSVAQLASNDFAAS